MMNKDHIGIAADKALKEMFSQGPTVKRNVQTKSGPSKRDTIIAVSLLLVTTLSFGYVVCWLTVPSQPKILNLDK